MGLIPTALKIQAAPYIFIIDIFLDRIFPTGRKKNDIYTMALMRPIIVEEALSRIANRMMIVPTRNCQERELKTLNRLYISLAFARRYGESVPPM
jgi:hypothetical protein